MLLSDRFFAMGTRAEVHLIWPKDDAHAAGSLHTVRAAIERVEASLSAFRPASPLCKLNADLSRGEPAKVDDPVLFEALDLARRMYTETHGLFDVTLGRVTLSRMRATGTGFEGVQLDCERSEVRCSSPDIAFDFGGLGKGIALDHVRTALSAHGSPCGIISLGGSSVLALGSHPNGDHWPLALPHPLRQSEILATLSLIDECWSVSASVIERDGHAQLHPHVLHPDTLEPVTQPRTTVVIDRSAARAEAFSTALLVASSEERVRIGTRLREARARVFDFNADSSFNMMELDRMSDHDGRTTTR